MRVPYGDLQVFPTQKKKTVQPFLKKKETTPFASEIRRMITSSIALVDGDSICVNENISGIYCMIDAIYEGGFVNATVCSSI